MRLVQPACRPTASRVQPARAELRRAAHQVSQQLSYLLDCDSVGTEHRVQHGLTAHVPVPHVQVPGGAAGLG